MSREALGMSPGRLSGIAVDESDQIITTSGMTLDPLELSPSVQQQIERHGKHVISGYDSGFKFGS